MMQLDLWLDSLVGLLMTLCFFHKIYTENSIMLQQSILHPFVISRLLCLIVQSNFSVDVDSTILPTDNGRSVCFLF